MMWFCWYCGYRRMLDADPVVLAQCPKCKLQTMVPEDDDEEPVLIG